MVVNFITYNESGISECIKYILNFGYMKRKQGYYWVKIKIGNRLSWNVAYWSDIGDWDIPRRPGATVLEVDENILVREI